MARSWRSNPVLDGAALRWMTLITVAVLAMAGTHAAAADDSTAEIARLIEALGDADYAARETAAASLAALGPASVDALLTAAETSGDLEVALRARWLADAIPPTSPQDTPAVTVELQRYAQADFTKRLQIMRRLLRLDEDAGIEPLARLVRLERSPDGARVAAAVEVNRRGKGARVVRDAVTHRAKGGHGAAVPVEGLVRSCGSWWRVHAVEKGGTLRKRTS